MQTSRNTPVDCIASHEVILLGRFNPPHKGHEALLGQMKTGSWIYVSSSFDKDSRDPLTVELRISILSKYWPHLVFLPGKDMWLSLDSVLSNYKNITIVTGEDREPDIRRLLKNYPTEDSQISIRTIPEKTTGHWRASTLRELIREESPLADNYFPSSFAPGDIALIKHLVK
jgi:hypothetical protein